MEEWRAIDGTDGKYEVSNTGKVRSVNYKNSGKTQELKPAADPKGYMKTMLKIKGKWKTVKVHRLVAEAFIPNPKGLPQVNHCDGNKENNRIDNLEWATNKDNAHHAIEHGLFTNSYKATHEANNRRKKKVIAIDSNGNSHIYESQSEAARELNVNRRHVQLVLKGERKQTGGYRFEYPKEGVMP